MLIANTSNSRLIRLTSSYFVAGVIISTGNKVCEAAPIVNYMLGWTVKDVLDYAKKRNWNVDELKD